MTEKDPKAIEVKRKYEERWLNIDGVIAIGIGMGQKETAIVISVKTDPEVIRKQIPSSVDGINIIIRQTGEIKAH